MPRQRAAATSILVYGEVVEYLKSVPSSTQRRRQLRERLVEIHPYALSYPTLDRYADLRRELRPPYGPGLIGDIDTVIVATALTRGLTLVTTDIDFLRVPGLNPILLDRTTFSPRRT